MSKKQKKQVPVYKAPDGTTVTIPLVVTVDESGEYWLTPDQIDYLEAARRSFEFAREAQGVVKTITANEAGSFNSVVVYRQVDATSPINTTSPRIGPIGSPA